MSAREHFVVRRSDCWEDSWTYGDWRQYICRRPNGALQCAKPSILPLVVTGLALSVLAMAVMGMVMLPPEKVAWERAIPAAVVSALVLILMWFAGRNIILMRAVGPRQYNGRRVFNHEVDDGPAA